MSIVNVVTYAVNSGLIPLEGDNSVLITAGLIRESTHSSLDNASLSKYTKEDLGLNAEKDNFPIVIDSSYEFEELKDHELNYGSQKEVSLSFDNDMIFSNSFTEQPLYSEDYYWGKYENGKAGADGLNRMSILKPGNSVAVIRDGYINVRTTNGYIQPASGYYFASGLCWSTSAMGAVMDQANIDFKLKYGIDLFTFNYGDRAPHSHYYRTYGNSNNGRGYTVMQSSPGVAKQDYKFTINPELANNPETKNIKIKIVMVATNEHESATYGQSIGGYIQSNLEF